jgi:hypothetical protein
MSYVGQPSRSQFGHPQVHLNASGVEEANGGETFALKLAIDYTLADAAVLYTVPANLPKIRIVSVFWEVTTAFTGGTSAAIGLSSSATGFTTKGMIHGGSSGDVLATLVAGYKVGTQGTGFTSAPKVVVLPAGSTIRFDRITDAFTAGAGFVHAECRMVG